MLTSWVIVTLRSRVIDIARKCVAGRGALPYSMGRKRTELAFDLERAPWRAETLEGKRGRQGNYDQNTDAP